MGKAFDLEPSEYSIQFGKDKQEVDASGYVIEVAFDSEPEYTDSLAWFVNNHENENKFGKIGLKATLETFKRETSNSDYIWNASLVDSITHEIGHASFAIMRRLFPSQWEERYSVSEIDHILEEIYMQVHSDLLEQFKEFVGSISEN